MSEHTSVLLGEVMRVKHGYAFPGEGFSDEPAWPTLVTPGNFAIGGGFKATKPKTFSGEYPDEYVLASGDLIITMTDLSKEGATLGLPATVPSDAVYLHNQRIGLVEVTESSVVNLAFLHYYLRTDGYRAHILGTATGSTVRHTSPSRISTYRADLPCLVEQQAVATVLGALDDKIAANTKLVGAVDEYLAAVILWHLNAGPQEVVPLSHIADINAESVKPSLENSLRYIDIASVGVGRFDIPAASAWSDAPSRARRRVRKGDTLWSTVRPNRRSHALNLSDDPLLVGSTGLAVVSARETGFAYLYQVTKLPHFTTYLEGAAEGSAYPAVRADRFGTAPVPLLPKAERDAFELVAAPLREHSASLDDENRTFAEVRDALLPQLISGTICVRDAEKRVEEVL